MPTPNEHALLSASGAERWLRCTPCARLEEKLPEQNSDYASEGRLAHAIAEQKLRKKYIEPIGTRTFNSHMKKLKEDPLYQEEMQGYTDEYLDYISGITMQYEHKPYVVAEKRVDYSSYAPEGFGTSDCIIIGADTMHVVDFKYGKGVPVDATDNPQMMLYALGALSAYSMLYNIKKVVITIVQPRLNNISEYEIDRDKLIDWGVFTVRPKAQAAFKGEGDYIPGEYCRFCRAKAQCRARAGAHTALEDFSGVNAPSLKESGKAPMPPLLTDAEVGEVLKRAQTLQAWVDSLEEYALSAILSGNQILGWKAVEGRSKREFDNTDAAFKVIKDAGYDEAILYERKPLTLAQIEKVIGKKKFSEIASSHIVTPPGKPTLAIESDKRPSYQTHNAANDFKDIPDTPKQTVVTKPMSDAEKKFLGLPQYDGAANIVRGDPYFARANNL